MKTRTTIVTTSIIMASVIVLSVMLAGCRPQSITPDVIKQQAIAKRAALLDAAMQLQASAATLSAQLQAAGIMDANVSGKIARLNAQAAKYIADANALAVALSRMELTGNTAADWITTVGTVNSAIPSPVQPYVNIGLVLASLISALIAKRKAAQAAESTLALTETVKGVQMFKDSDVPTPVREALKESLLSAQSTSTKQTVAAIKAAL